MLPLSQLVCNEGQIDGVPANPRIIKDDRFKALVESLKEDDLTGVEPLKVYPLGDVFVVLGGNMRFRALQELNAKEVACLVVPDGTDAKVLRKIVMIDNAGFGEYDFDMLANEWDVEELKDWGVDVPQFGLPEELDGVDLNPDELEELSGDGKTDMERVIIVFKKEQSDAVAELLGVERIEKVVYRFDEMNSK